MPLISIEEIPSRRLIYKSASTILRESAAQVSSTEQFDIFLSHSYSDADLILGLKEYLNSFDIKVYVDWETDAQLDRTKVNQNTANLLRSRMKQCRGLLYAISENSKASIWMPWELGFFDGFNGQCAILPLTIQKQNSEEYKGQEYLGLYPYVIRCENENGLEQLWVQTSPKKYVNINKWLNGVNPYIHN